MTETEILMDEYGVPPPSREDYPDDVSFVAAQDAWIAGFSAFVLQREEELRASQAAAEEEFRREEEKAEVAATEDLDQGREEVSSVSPPLLDPETSDRYVVGSYIDSAGNVWSPAGELLSHDGALIDSYIDQAGHKWYLEMSSPSMEQQPLAEGDIATGDPAIDTALLFLDLFEELTGEEGTVSDVDGIQKVLDHPVMTTSFQDYTVTEGLLLLMLLCVFMAACAKMLKGGFSWLR